MNDDTGPGYTMEAIVLASIAVTHAARKLSRLRIDHADDMWTDTTLGYDRVMAAEMELRHAVTALVDAHTADLNATEEEP